jgi:hypothetical protein
VGHDLRQKGDALERMPEVGRDVPDRHVHGSITGSDEGARGVTIG